ncbi:hypothetical protein K505DRAFT_372805 [Melanomma pulvis-pyrius CBS 109.77]|uniref:DUF4238 domain-containing protein n=1 Tax=Melanomma pulvis-pyrius CBS 109.77 TaxID=1314802 RepID=A0A6A6XLL7_9PLEO|nr:hypothetical protein K505DRAFT_372805 [Melanomma pulvis-pyrius CBS 109.77]
MDRSSKFQYQHYVPQFLLRNFSYQNQKWKKTKDRKQLYPGDPMLRAVDLTVSPPELIEVPVKHTFGKPDMYKDDSKFTRKQQMHIEAKLSRLESATSHVIRKIVKAHAEGKTEISMSRPEKDLLRKFMFVMKYRGPIFFQRFNHQNAEDYNSVDKPSFLEYMRKKNYQRPLDVWFDNLSQIMDMTIDPEGKWVTKLSERIYPGDAEWVSQNIRSMYLALCTPSNPSEEFILTENAFSIYEGPTSCSVNPKTGERTVTAYTEFHVLGIISPSLMMILRSNLLPEPREDRNEEVRMQRAMWLEVHMQCHTDPKNARSVLEDLPVAKARSSYTTEADGQIVLAEGEVGTHRSSDKFCFTFFSISSNHVQMLNSVMLDQACHTSLIIYRSQAALKSALEYYLDMPTQINGIYSMKPVSDRPDDPIKQLLEKLENIAQDLGSNVKARYHVDPLDEGDSQAIFENAVVEVLKQVSPVVDYNKFNQWSITNCMEILVKMTQKLGLPIRALHALDLIMEPTGHPDFPDMVFNGIHKASQGIHTQSSQDIVSISRSVWRFSWETLCSTAVEKSGGDMSDDIEVVKEKVAESDYAFLLQKGASSKEWGNDTLLQTTNELVCGPNPTSQAGHEFSKTTFGQTSPQRSTDFSKSGLSKAFDQIGHDLAREKSLNWRTTKHISRDALDQMQRAKSSNVDGPGKQKNHRQVDAHLTRDQVEKYKLRNESDQAETSGFDPPVHEAKELGNLMKANVTPKVAFIILICTPLQVRQEWSPSVTAWMPEVPVVTPAPSVWTPASAVPTVPTLPSFTYPVDAASPTASVKQGTHIDAAGRVGFTVSMVVLGIFIGCSILGSLYFLSKKGLCCSCERTAKGPRLDRPESHHLRHLPPPVASTSPPIRPNYNINRFSSIISGPRSPLPWQDIDRDTTNFKYSGNATRQEDLK